MATPLFDAVDMRLSRALRDPVNYTTPGVASDGKVFSAANRQNFLNRANIFIQQTIFGQCVALYGDTEIARNATRRILQNLVKTSSSISFSASGVAVSGVASDYGGIPIALAKTGSTSSFVYRANKQDLDNNIDIDVRHAFAIEGGKVYAYESGVILATGAGTLIYVASDQVTQNGATDLLLPVQFYDPLIDLAAWYALTETPKADVADAKSFYERAMAFLGRFK